MTDKARVVQFLRDEAAMARSMAGAAKVEEERMYRIGAHDALLLASDAIERGDLLIWDRPGEVG